MTELVDKHLAVEGKKLYELGWCAKCALDRARERNYFSAEFLFFNVSPNRRANINGQVVNFEPCMCYFCVSLFEQFYRKEGSKNYRKK